MDRKIERKRSKMDLLWKVGIPFLLMLGVVLAYKGKGNQTRQTVQLQRLSLSEVRTGVFTDDIPVNATVVPLKTVYLDAVQGGMVKEVYFSEGDFVETGQVLAKFENTEFQLQVFAQEARISEQLDINANTRLSLDQNELDLRTKVNDIEYQVTDLKRQLESRRKLYEKRIIAKNELDEIQDQYDYNLRYLHLVRAAQKQEQEIRDAKIQQLKDSEERLQEHLKVIRESLSGLLVKASISGQLTALDMEIGESKSRGDRLGQIDKVDGYKLVANIDAFYISRVRVGQEAIYVGETQPVKVSISKIYPEVDERQFQVDLSFNSPVSEGLKRGQNLLLRLNLGENKNSLLIDNGNFYSDTGGDWVYVLGADKRSAVKRDVLLGRRSTSFIEVLNGLSEGDWVVVSSYANYDAVDVLRIDES